MFCEWSLYSEATLPTHAGVMRLRVYRGSDAEAIALISGHLTKAEPTQVRIHSACFTGETLGSLKCDCREQLNFALEYIGKHDGVLIYLPQEGRGIGLGDKIRAYALQERGVDTLDANHLLGLPIDARSYEAAAAILRDLDVDRVNLLTNNPAKISALRSLGITVCARIPVVVQPNPFSESYLYAKRVRMGHLLEDSLGENEAQLPRSYGLKRNGAGAACE